MDKETTIMSMEEKEYFEILEELKNHLYQVRFKANPELIANIVNMIKGDDKTSQQFAAELGISSTKLSRIMNGRITRSLSEELLISIAEHMNEDVRPHLSILIRANGMVEQRKCEVPDQLDMHLTKQLRVSDKVNQRRYREEVDRNILAKMLMGELFFRNKKGSLLGVHTKCPINKSFINDENEHIYDIVIQIKGDTHTCYWAIDVIFKKFKHASRRADFIFRQEYDLFLLDLWNPELYREKVVHTFVFFDENEYEEFLDKTKDIKTNGVFSIMLVEADGGAVICEHIMQNLNTEQPRSLLSSVK